MNPQAIKLACIVKSIKVRPQQGSAGKAGKQQGSEKMFAQLLNQTLSSAKGAFSAEAHQKACRARTERGWLEHFRNRLLSAGIPLKDLSISQKALPQLKKLLLAEGYSEGDVNGFLERLFGGQGRREIKITQLFEKLSELKVLADKESREPILEVSTLPHLETLLRCLGLDVRQANRAISQARVDGGGLRLKGLVRNLKEIISKGTQGTKAGTSQPSADDIKAMLARIGMVDEAATTKGPISLERFVQMLEQKIASLMPNRLSNGQTQNQVIQLMEHVLAPSREQDQSPGVQPLDGRKLQALSRDGVKGKGSGKQMTQEWKETASEAKKAPDKQIAQGWKETASEARKAAAEPGGSSEFQTNKDKAFPETDKLLDAVHKAPAEKTFDQKGWAAAQFAKEAVTAKVALSETATRQESRPIPAYVVDQVARRLGLALKRGENQVRLQLRPPHLGSIQLEVSMKDNILKVAMMAEHHSVKELLTSHVHELRQAFAEQGIELQKIDVEVGHHHSGQSMSNAQRDLNEARARRRNMASASGGLESEVDSAELTPTNVRSDALLDMFA